MNFGLPQKLILFYLDNKPFGLDVTAVQEILSHVAARQVPRSAKHIEGVFDFRGNIIPLINLRGLLSLTETNSIGNVIVVSQQNQLMGLIVDKVMAVLTDQDQIKHLELGQQNIPYVQGFVAYKEQEIAILSLAKLATTIAVKEETNVSHNA